MLPETGDLSIGYHSRPCYSNFNAINVRYREPETSCSQLQHTSQDDSAQDLSELEEAQDFSQVEQTQDDNQDVCTESVESHSSNNEHRTSRTYIFCNKQYKRVKGHLYNLATVQTLIFLKIYFATKLNDYNVLNEINMYVSSNSSFPYHNTCKMNYHGKKIAESHRKKDWHEHRDHYKSAFKQLCLFVKDYIIDKRNCCFVEFIEDLFLEFLSQSYGDCSIDKSMFSSRHIPQRIVGKYKKYIRFEAKPNQPKIIQPYKVSIVLSMTEMKDRDCIQRATFMLRQDIRNIQLTKLGNIVD